MPTPPRPDTPPSCAGFPIRLRAKLPDDSGRQKSGDNRDRRHGGRGEGRRCAIEALDGRRLWHRIVFEPSETFPGGRGELSLKNVQIPANYVSNGQTAALMRIWSRIPTNWTTCSALKIPSTPLVL